MKMAGLDNIKKKLALYMNLKSNDKFEIVYNR